MNEKNKDYQENSKEVELSIFI